VLRDDVQFDAAIERRIAERLRHDCSPRHVPDDIIAVAEVPRTATGELPEISVKQILNGVPLEKTVARLAGESTRA
jgi:acetoacetyl-CoA synthetase